METLVGFRAWRYQQRTAGDLGRLVAPPYDVIGPELQAELYARSPYNVVRVDLGLTAPGDSEAENQYTRAAQQLEAWKESGVLVRDPEPTVTFVEETFRGPDGRERTRRGFLSLVKLHHFGEGIVFPHEFTLSAPKEDRFRLMRATKMSLSPVFLLYDLPGDDIIAAWAAGVGASDPEATISDEAEPARAVADLRSALLVDRAVRGAAFDNCRWSSPLHGASLPAVSADVDRDAPAGKKGEVWATTTRLTFQHGRSRSGHLRHSSPAVRAATREGGCSAHDACRYLYCGTACG